MLFENLKKIFKEFKPEGELISYKELASGHINDTYLIETNQKLFFVLQRINHSVFKDIPGLIKNKLKVSEHILKKLAHIPKKERTRRVLTFIGTKNENSFYKDDVGNFWNMMLYIDNSLTFEIVTNEKVAFEGGKLFGEFLKLTNDFNTNQLIEVIPKFHDMSFRFSQFEESLKVASNERLEQAKRYIDLVWLMKDEMHILQMLKDSGAIKLRVTHNDTKISNALFDFDNNALCVIDTDTIMPGIIHYDFGDAIRTICNTAAEDEINLDLVNFNLEYYKAYLKGFLDMMKQSLTPTELKHLPLGAKTMIFIMALRFLTDFLKGDIYYKTSYCHHNLNRAKNQFKLIESLSEKFEDMKMSIPSI